MRMKRAFRENNNGNLLCCIVYLLTGFSNNLTIFFFEIKKEEKTIIYIFTTKIQSLLVFWPICFQLFWKEKREQLGGKILFLFKKNIMYSS